MFQKENGQRKLKKNDKIKHLDRNGLNNHISNLMAIKIPGHNIVHEVIMKRNNHKSNLCTVCYKSI